jgi:CRISPR type III-B/RAMP module-associated protein Cmr5
MRNLEQTRAANALTATCGQNPVRDKGVDRLPAMIINNGLLAATAFVMDKTDETGTEMQRAIYALVTHLRSVNRLTRARDGKAMIEELSDQVSTSAKLRLATAEALAYLVYLKRFAQKSKKGGE